MKYNWSIIGHKRSLSQIEHDISSGNLSHAYLFTGPACVGKYAVAKKFATILQCANDFCHDCPSCKQIAAGSHIDTVDMFDDGNSIKIEEVRKLVEQISMTKQSTYKIIIIQKIERMTPEAANSFLKTLEEPPKGTIFILTTSSLKLLLPTVVSRVRVVKFESFSYSYLFEAMTKAYPEAEIDDVKKACLFALGRAGKAAELLEDADLFASYLNIYNDIERFLDHRNVVDRFKYAEKLVENQEEMDLFLDLLTNILRSRVLEGSPRAIKHIKTLSKIEEAGMLLQRNVNNKLVLENLMLEI